MLSAPDVLMAFLPHGPGGSVRLDPEAKLLRIAARQYSVFCNRQALEVGVSERTIRRRVESGLLVRLHRGVFLPSSVGIGWEQRVMGTQLACGPDVAVSFGSGAAVWDFVDDVETPHVTVPARTSREHEGIIVHRASKLEVVTHRRFRVTSPMRTLTDLASEWEEVRLERALDKAHRRRIVHLERFAEYLDRSENRSRPGSGLLRKMVAARDPNRPIDSDLETLFFSALRKFGLPLPVPQHPVQTRSSIKYIDFAYPEHRLAIELDGFEEHGTRRAFEADRVRQNELEELGYHFRRFTWTQLTSDAVGVAITVGSALGLVPKRWGPRVAPARTARRGGGASAAPLRRTSRRA